MALRSMPKAGQILHLNRWQETRAAVALRDGFRCAKCKARTFLTGKLAGEIDHKIPRRELLKSGGDLFDMSNLQLLCQPCHARKSILERYAFQRAQEAENPTPKPKKSRADRLRARSRVSGRKAFLLAAGLAPADIIT